MAKNLNVIAHGSSLQWIDLTHTLEPSIPCWDKSCGFENTVQLDYADCKDAVKFRVQHIAMDAGIGTHIDAPAHCTPGGLTIDQLLLTDLQANCVVIDVSDKAHERYTLSVTDVAQFEQQYGKIPPSSFVLIRTGWDKFWMQPEKYHNNHVFPSVSLRAAQLLLDRQIAGLGIDTLSPDRPEDGYTVHALLLGAGKYIIENVANAALLPPCGSRILIFPIKIKGGTEAPIRLVAIV
ncbi:cyclase family protein [Legionella geestiana]|nr:cyclase family protein [Legionella geestiana]QBS13459.1 cyclase family protein [Legionella geestiana]QDQ41059.1 cyclase family protein [Legionella geestiana]